MKNYQRFPGEAALANDFLEGAASKYLPISAMEYIEALIPDACRYTVVVSKHTVYINLVGEDIKPGYKGPCSINMYWSILTGSHRDGINYTLIISHDNKQKAFPCE